MKRREIIVLRHEETGRSVRAEVIQERKGGKFMKVWQDTGWEGRIGGLRGNSLKVLWYLMMVAGWGNKVPGPGEVAERMKQKRPNVSRAYKELIGASFLHKTGGAYLLDPYYCWKGNDEQYEEACRKLSSPASPLMVGRRGEKEKQEKQWNQSNTPGTIYYPAPKESPTYWKEESDKIIKEVRG